jgi:CRISPR/Cas system-associated exonuclease Cas4 (RecB family)
MAPRTRRVTASQVGQYAFCARAWWLATVEKREPAHQARLEIGQVVHERHGWDVTLARTGRRLAIVLALACVLALAAWAILTLAR